MTEPNNSPVPPWRQQQQPAQTEQPQQQPQQVMIPNTPVEDDPLSSLEQALRTPGVAWALVIGFAGGFGFGAVLLIFVLTLFKKPIEGPYMWYVYGAIAALGFVLWSYFLSRIRIYRSQAQDPDFAEYTSKAKRETRKKRKKRRQKPDADIDEDEEDPDEDDEPWV